MYLDLHDAIVVKPAIYPLVITDNTASVSQIIDTAGYRGLEFVIGTGTLADTDATFTCLLEASDVSDLSTGKITIDGTTGRIGGDPSFDFSADNKCQRVGYNGSKRYVRLTITPANNTGNAPIAAFAVLTPMKQPEAQA